MTEEEAKKILRKLLAEDDDIDFFSYDEKKAINHFAYLPENKGDLISRQAVLARVRLNFTIHQTIERHEIEDIIKSEPSAENKGEWIPVTERLPKIADVYRVTRYYPNNVMNPQYLVDACAFDGSDTWYDDNRINHERAYVNNVIAWQENPEPYKEGGE